jgi:hypothetical protein
VTNTVPLDMQKLQCHKLKTVDISILLAEAIRRIHNKVKNFTWEPVNGCLTLNIFQESMSHLFRNVTLED